MIDVVTDLLGKMVETGRISGGSYGSLEKSCRIPDVIGLVRAVFMTKDGPAMLVEITENHTSWRNVQIGDLTTVWIGGDSDAYLTVKR